MSQESLADLTSSDPTLALLKQGVKLLFQQGAFSPKLLVFQGRAELLLNPLGEVRGTHREGSALLLYCLS